jgi:adenine-specific DNA-methyltransferase
VLESVMLVSLMEAADRVDSTCGLQMAYLKEWAPRAHNDLELRVPDVLPAVPHGPCEAFGLDALEAAARLEADVAYLDPPYNQHSYLSNYHIWETLIRWDRPSAYGVARKREDCRTRKSAFNVRTQSLEAFRAVVRSMRASLLVVSFNDEGFLAREQIEAALSERGEVVVLTKDFKRYVGAQIGIYNPRGEKVGKVSHLRNREFIYVVATDRSAARGTLAARLAGLADDADVLDRDGERRVRSAR